MTFHDHFDLPVLPVFPVSVGTLEIYAEYIRWYFYRKPGAILFFFFFFFFSTGLVWLLHYQSSTEILPDYWGTFCAGFCPMSVFFPFLVAAGFEPTSLSLGGGRLNRYPILTPQNPLHLKGDNPLIPLNISLSQEHFKQHVKRLLSARDRPQTDQLSRANHFNSITRTPLKLHFTSREWLFAETEVAVSRCGARSFLSLRCPVKHRLRCPGYPLKLYFQIPCVFPVFSLSKPQIFPVPIYIICEYYIHRTDLADLLEKKWILLRRLSQYPLLLESEHLQLELTKFPVFSVCLYKIP